MNVYKTEVQQPVKIQGRQGLQGEQSH